MIGLTAALHVITTESYATNLKGCLKQPTSDAPQLMDKLVSPEYREDASECTCQNVYICFGAKRAQLKKPAIYSKQSPKKCQKIHTTRTYPPDSRT